jgi:hypothetical protein
MKLTPEESQFVAASTEALMKARQEAQKPPYPFCCHPDKCCATGRCERRVGGELWCCAD